MFVQFFGSFLLERKLIDKKSLLSAIEYASKSSVKIGQVAIEANFLTPDLVDEIQIKQTREDKRFCEICLCDGYLTEDQVDYLLSHQVPVYRLLGSYLDEQGIIPIDTYNELIQEYLDKYHVSIEKLDIDDIVFVNELLKTYLSNHGIEKTSLLADYVKLVFNDLVRFIGTGFVALAPYKIDNVSTSNYAAQDIVGSFNLQSIIDMDSDAAIKFASSYASMEFEEFDEYVQASLEDFLNLNNGLFCVSMSEQNGIELTLTPPSSGLDLTADLGNSCYCIPVVYPWGEINIILNTK